ncbi:MAG: hypothetical protein M1426_03435, partial [Patescibacteria group bacterium]|nr:hypothetical protein [Patescibacteria group bacterium]
YISSPPCCDHPFTTGIYKNIITDAQKIAGFPRHRSVHPGGIIIAPEKITHFTALEESGKGIIVSHHDMYSIEKLGLVKMDLLGVRGLSILADCIHTLRFSGLNSIPLNDTATFDFIRSGKTIGCFQLESPAMRGLLRKMQIQNLEDVIVAVALIRPGPAEGGMKDTYIRRRAGLEKPTYPAPDLESVLGETYGVLVYQEQVLQVASVVAGFSYAEADLLRRAMTKSRTKSVMDEIRMKFLQGAIHKGTAPETAEKVWEVLSHFVGYGFNKAHSATYGLLAYQSAYIKLHYPAVFMTAVLNNGGGFYDTAEYVEECRRLGLTILPPDVNSAEEGYTCEKQSIRVGLGMVKELTKKTLTRIIEQRNQKKFGNFFDFITRCCPGETEVVNLIKSGALRSLEESEPLLLTQTKIYFRNRRNTTMAKLLTEGLYFPPYPRAQKIRCELEILGQAVSAHPLTLFTNLLVDPGIIPAADIENRLGHRITIAGWLVTSRRVLVKDSYMKFLTLEDPSGIAEAVLFPSVYQRFGALLKTRGPYVVTGTVQSRVPGEVNLIIDHLHLVQGAVSNRSASTSISEKEKPIIVE